MLHELVIEAQLRFKVCPSDTVLAGFSQGAIMSLEFALAYDGLVGKVLAFSGRFARIPVGAPALTKLHLFHGEDDNIMSFSHAITALKSIESLGGRATLDAAQAVSHQLHPELIRRAVERLQAD